MICLCGGVYQIVNIVKPYNRTAEAEEKQVYNIPPGKPEQVRWGEHNYPRKNFGKDTGVNRSPYAKCQGTLNDLSSLGPQFNGLCKRKRV